MPEKQEDGTVVFTAQEHENLAEFMEAMRDFTERTMGTAKEFVDRVEAGEIRSTYTYNQMKGLCDEWFGPAGEEGHDDEPASG